VIGSLVGNAAMVLALFFFLRRKWRPSSEFHGISQSLHHHEMPPNGSHEKSELYGSSKVATEMSAHSNYVPGYTRALPGVYEVDDGSMVAKEPSSTNSSEQSPVSPEQY